jgi:hypothetical protein
VPYATAEFVPPLDKPSVCASRYEPLNQRWLSLAFLSWRLLCPCGSFVLAAPQFSDIRGMLTLKDGVRLMKDDVFLYLKGIPASFIYL